MTGSIESASVEEPRILFCGLNWVGDSIMAMPALQAYHRRNPGHRVVALVKPPVAPLWAMHTMVEEVILLEPGAGGVWRSAKMLRLAAFATTYILPHSFRSALPPFLAGIPRRIGLPSWGRDWMLTDVRRPQCGEERNHQAFEYLDLLCPNGGEEEFEPPQLSPPATAIEDATKWLPDAEGPWVGLLPGAARGPSKQWPEEHFIALGKAIQENEGRRVVVLGGEGEIELCQRITQKIGAGTLCLAGRTTLESWAAVLQRCAVVVANDSGGMHLAAAMATPVVALFGITDPAKTGPLGPSIVLQHGARASRDIPRESQEARFHLASIHPNEVYDAVELVLTSSADEVASL